MPNRLCIVHRCFISCSMPARPPSCTLFPYTTLFRSVSRIDSTIRSMWPRIASAPIIVLLHPWCWSLVEPGAGSTRSEEHTSELQSRGHLVCRLLLEKTNPREHSDQQRVLGMPSVHRD